MLKIYYEEKKWLQIISVFCFQTYTNCFCMMLKDIQIT